MIAQHDWQRRLRILIRRVLLKGGGRSMRPASQQRNARYGMTKGRVPPLPTDLARQLLTRPKPLILARVHPALISRAWDRGA